MMADRSFPDAYLHAPMQACCDQTLVRMKRKYGMEEMLLFDSRQSRSFTVFGTDRWLVFLVRAKATLRRLATVLTCPLRIVTVTFSEREEHRRQNGQASFRRKGARAAPICEDSASKRMSFHENQLGKVFRVLLENPKDGFYSGYTDHYVRVVVPEAPRGLENRMALIKMKKASPEFIEGELVSYEGDAEA